MNREAWLDFMRVSACFMVMMVHSTEPFYLGGDGALVLAVVSAWLRGWLGVGADGVLGVWTTPVEILGTVLLAFVVTGLVSILVQRIPRVGKYLMG